MNARMGGNMQSLSQAKLLEQVRADQR
jgi:hypothetical protein